MSSKTKNQEAFRDSISTVDAQGKRVWLYPTQPEGRFYNMRKWVSYALLGLLFGAPFVKIGSQPLLLLDVLDRKFIIFGKLFVPQDFFLFALGMLLFFVFIVLFTVVYGRLWCGWACPQTIFMEMLYRRIEYWVEGDAAAQRCLDKSEWNSEKNRQRLIKHSLFMIISFFLANMFLAYFIGVERLEALVTKPPTENWGTFVAVAITTGVIYYIYARFREQVCTTFCPYGRLQGVLLDKNSIVVSYDHVRGEPRGKLKKEEEVAEKTGDCIDCGLCVRVCPTGIDIRNGTQLECVNCTACIDACDSIMDKIEKPRGLVRYASENEIATGNNKIFTTRTIAYTAVLAVLLAVMSFLLISRNAIEATVLRAPGTLYQTTEKGNIKNLYTLQVANKTIDPMLIALKIVAPSSGIISMVGDPQLKLEGKGVANGAFFLELPSAEVTEVKTDIKLGIYANGVLIETVETTFVGPFK